MREHRTTKMRKCRCMKFLCIISGCPEGARKWRILFFAMLLHSKNPLKPKFQRIWSECRDLNPRPLGPEPSAIPNFATPRRLLYYKQKNAGCQALNSKTPEILRFFRKTRGNGAQDAAFPAAGGGFGRGMPRTHEGTRRMPEEMRQTIEGTRRAAAAHGDPCRAAARRDASGGNSARTDPAERTFINTAARCRRRTRAAANPWAAAPTKSAEAPA